jgi:predicted DNA-binding protein
MYTVQISEDLGKRLTDLAEKTHHPVSYYTEQALAQLLEDAEDYHMALEAIAEGGPNIPLEEVEKRLGLSGAA